MSKIIKKKIKIEGMHCSSCAMNIDFDLEDLDGVKTAKTNYAKQENPFAAQIVGVFNRDEV